MPLIVLLSDFVIPIGFWSAANCIEWYPDWTDPHPVAAEIKTQKIRIATISTMQRKDPGHVFLEMRDSFHECTIQHTYADCINVMNALASRPDWVFEIDSEAQISDRLGLLLDNICAGGTVADIPAAGPSPTLASAN